MVKCTQSLFTKISHSGIIILNFFMLEFGTERQIHKMFFLNNNSGILTSASYIYGFVAFRVSKQNNYSSVTQTLSLSRHYSKDIWSNIKSNWASQPLNRCSVVPFHWALRNPSDVAGERHLKWIVHTKIKLKQLLFTHVVSNLYTVIIVYTVVYTVV